MIERGYIGRKKSARSKPRMGPYSTYREMRLRGRPEETSTKEKRTKNSTMRGTIVVRPAWKSHSVLYVRLPNDRRLAPLKESSSNVTIYLIGES